MTWFQMDFAKNMFLGNHTSLIFYRKNHLKYVETAYCLKQSLKISILICIDFYKFLLLPTFCLRLSQFAERPGCASCRALKITLNNTASDLQNCKNLPILP